MNKKKSCGLCRNFICIYKINRTLHGRLGIRILSSHAERISYSFASLNCKRYFQHSKIKFIFPRSHVISSMSRVRSLKDQGRIYNYVLRHMISPTARSFKLCWINKLQLLKNGCQLLGVFGSGRQGVKLSFLNSNFTLTLGYLNPALNNLALVFEY